MYGIRNANYSRSESTPYAQGWLMRESGEPHVQALEQLECPQHTWSHQEANEEKALVGFIILACLVNNFI